MPRQVVPRASVVERSGEGWAAPGPQPYRMGVGLPGRGGPIGDAPGFDSRARWRNQTHQGKGESWGTIG